MELPQPVFITIRNPTFVPYFDHESLTLFYHVCEIAVPNIIKKIINMKALLTALGSCYCGYACYQYCNCKEVGYDYKKYIHIINFIQYKKKLIKIYHFRI